MEDFIKKYVNFKNIIFTVVALTFLIFIITCKEITIVFFASFVIACSLNPIVDKLEKKMPRHLAAVLVCFGILFIFLAIFIPVCIASIEQIRHFFYKLPVYIDNFDEFLFKFPFAHKIKFLADNADNVMEQLSLSYSDILYRALDIGKNVGTALTYLLVSIIIIFNMVIDKNSIKNFYLHLFPENMRENAKEVGNIIAKKMGGYLLSFFGTSLSVAIIMAIGLALLRVPYPILLGIITGVFDIVPIIGPAIALLICIIATYEAGMNAVIATIVVFAIAQLVENNFVRPFFFSKIMNVNTIVIFLFMFIAIKYLGVVGVIFAPALAAMASVLFEELYLKKINETNTENKEE